MRIHGQQLNEHDHTLFCGDNLRVMESMPDPFVDLCYIDPPFFSKRNYEVLWGETAERRMFEDRWKGGLQVYLDWMEPRIRHIHRLLKPRGSFYLHCDWHAGHYLKVLCDEIFGYNRFVNEVVWYYKGAGVSPRYWGRRHDTIFWYAKSDQWYFDRDPVRMPYAETTKERFSHYIGNVRKGRDFGQQTLHPEGKHPDDVLQIPIEAPSSRRRMGYPTQKPEELLRQLVVSSCPPHGMVFDPFCGCGTTLAAAQALGRGWAGCDVSATALRVVKERLSKLHAGEISVIGMPATRKELEAMNPFEFQNWAISTVFGIHAPRRAGDRGIDGFTGWLQTPIQVKQQDHVGRPVVQQFRGALKNKKKGVIIALGFTSTAHEEAARLRREEQVELVLLTCDEILSQDFDAITL